MTKPKARRKIRKRRKNAATPWMLGSLMGKDRRRGKDRRKSKRTRSR